MSHTIEIEQLSKTFRPVSGLGKWINTSAIFHEIRALQDVTLYLEQGETFGLLGPNGAGKTTLLKILSTLIRPTSGSVRILGYDLNQEEEKIKEKIGLVYSNERSFYWRLSGRENLLFFGSLMNLSGRELKRRILELSSSLGMESFLDNRYDAYSTGMKQRLLVARGLLGNPEILFLDEPTRGLDPASSENLLQHIRALALEMKTTILMVTHSLSEAERFCDRIGILHQGRMICHGCLEELRESFQSSSRYRFYIPSLNIKIMDQIEDVPWVTDARWSNGRGEIKIDVEIQEPAKNLSKLFGLFQERGIPIVHVEAFESELNSIFIQATKKEAG